MADNPGDVTRLLHQLGRGNAQAADQLVPLIYDELRRPRERSDRNGRRLELRGRNERTPAAAARRTVTRRTMA